MWALAGFELGLFEQNVSTLTIDQHGLFVTVCDAFASILDNIILFLISKLHHLRSSGHI